MESFIQPSFKRTKLEPNFDPAPTAVASIDADYVSPYQGRECLKRATLVAEKVDAAGRHVRQIELCEPHLDFVIERERNRGFKFGTGEATTRSGARGPRRAHDLVSARA